MITERSIGAAIKSVRTRARLSQHQVANAIEVDVNYLSAVEQGHRRPSLPLLLKIADAASVKASNILAIAEVLDMSDDK